MTRSTPHSPRLPCPGPVFYSFYKLHK
uniref:Uncharacterized protein n=1 Tax=Anguilla anguilla TaxID=7936 RepID=A0A0E9XRK7_ANGAN